ncbi:MAG: UDP-N-acetylmuramoyl-tripeptide--D-alanyl-D-alanine ligase [Candidatus Gastranaerophilales bacterium]|nr:UDP-N-acetylmuramoyl-tripeptide--D-alanyl-D-alanine ligase [Candidatus Gastranaerophilales bacterium]
MQFNLKEIINAIDCEILYKSDLANDEILFDISTDTRKIKQGDVYLPLRGENFDGHNFIDKAIINGARGYFTQDKFKINKEADFIIYVQNALVAYLKLANYIRNKVNPIVVAITGSCGKTTTKEMLYRVFSTQYRTYKTFLNHNNEIGLCETFFNMPINTEVLIVEMGMRNLGEIELLSNYSNPDIGIISNIGSAHVERLGTLKNIAIAKCEIVKNLKKDGLFIGVDGDSLRENLNYEGKKIFTTLEDAKNIQISIGSTTFEYKGEVYEITQPGEYNVSNAILVIEAALNKGITVQNIKRGLSSYKPIEKRWEKTQIKGLTFVNDSYNANPESMNAVLKTFLAIYQSPMTLVLGDMGELGKDEIMYHKQVGEFLSQYSGIKLLTVGTLARHIARNTTLESVEFENNEQCAKYIVENVEKGSTILLKASRSMKFEQIIEMVEKL